MLDPQSYPHFWKPPHLGLADEAFFPMGSPGSQIQAGWWVFIWFRVATLLGHKLMKPWG